MPSAIDSWQRFQKYLFHDEELGLSLDVSRMGFDEGFLAVMQKPLAKAMESIAALEAGAIANPDEGRMVGHYWLRDSQRAPTIELRTAIDKNLARVQQFVADVHGAKIRGQMDEPFTHVLTIGIGGSALGPQLVADALGTDGDMMTPAFMDNTDPDGISRALYGIEAPLHRTLVLAISKSGGTPETRNGMIQAMAAYKKAGLDFAKHAVAVTGEGSKLDQQAASEGWLARFPMWDWVGGRVSVTATVGLLPAALQGVDIEHFLEGARAMDERTRRRKLEENPAAWLALMWHWAGGGKGAKDMVILPYKDRLALFGKYLQQLVMESLGKELDLAGNKVEQGIVVLGNKGSTDQHAYVQELRDGLNNFFVTFIEVLRDDAGSALDGLVDVEPGIGAGDYLEGFLLGTRQALADKGRESMTLTIRELNAFSLGMLIALYERAVGIYAALVGVNAYNQPGVEAGKKAAATVLDLQKTLLAAMTAAPGQAKTAEEWAKAIGAEDRAEWVYKLLERLAANPERNLARVTAVLPADTTYAAR
jgi:glucose-6-phosphate isomerase